MNKNLDYIKKKLSLLPMSPGCYLMKNTEGKVIYVGKARKLKNRVSSYFTGAHNYKTTKLVDHIWDFDYIVTGSEKEALLLEINLIKDYTPEYNIMFMDNTYYPYIELTDETHPRLKIVRKTKNKKNKYFGPYPDATAARNTFKLLNKLYPLRKCNHVPDKPCLYYSLHQCLGPCINDIDKGYISIQLFFMREGKLLYHDFNLEPVGEDFEEDLIRFLVTYYQTHPEPYELLVPQDVDQELLTEILSCHVLQPQRGDKKSLVEMANKNAKEALEKKFLLKEKTDEKTILPIIELGKKLGIDTPHTIELYDNSNIQGAYAVAGMVVYKDGVPSKKDYRKYKIKTVEGPDDYASMKEVIYRRYYRLLMEQKEMADLIIVDGGLGQIKVAKEVIDSLNLSVHICGLSKDDKHSTAMLLDENGNQVPIDTKSPLFFLLTRMQDEVHRYAISFHRQVRSKSLFSSILDEVDGIGEARKKKLLNHFKSVKKMKEATLEELEAVIPKNTALKLYEVLHKD